MFHIKPLLFLTLFGLFSLVKTETQPNKYTSTLEHINVPSAHSSKTTPQTLVHYFYPPYIIKHLQRRNFLFVPIIASNSAILNKDVYGSHNPENVQHKRHPKSVFIVYPENQKPPTQPCNLNITDSYTTTTVPPPTTIVDDIKTCIHPSDEHSTTTPLPFTTPSIPSTDSTTSFNSPIPTNPSSPPTSTEAIQPPSSTTSTIETEPSMTSTFPSTSENPTKPTTQTTITIISDKQTITTTINPNQITSTTSQLWTPSTNKTPTLSSTRPTISPPIIKDPTGTGKMQCSFNGLFRANNFTCDQYLVCINGLTHVMDCPNGLAFDDDKKTCDWPGNVEGCNPRAFENFECPYDLPGDGNIISTFRYRDSCSQFIACYKRKPRLLTCREGFFFDEDSQDCIYFKNVTNCKSILYSF